MHVALRGRPAPASSPGHINRERFVALLEQLKGTLLAAAEAPGPPLRSGSFCSTPSPFFSSSQKVDGGPRG